MRAGIIIFILIHLGLLFIGIGLIHVIMDIGFALAGLGLWEKFKPKKEEEPDIYDDYHVVPFDHPSRLPCKTHLTNQPQ